MTSIKELNIGDYIMFRRDNDNNSYPGEVLLKGHMTGQDTFKIFARVKVGNLTEPVMITDDDDFTVVEKTEDNVNSPSHYNYGDIEVIDYCDQVCKQYSPELAPYVFNAIKYLSRANHKGGKNDIAKAKYYIQRLFDKWEGD
ncbi:DUF3310 domain-containing protein [Staphylococcus lugdunensis]|uniref:DUF3310 domain-containing protein n=2 Tax=Staphylococcus TaxID=1279 RepID=UPI001F4CBBDA|nr:DUF3310 domain-containing protein [Staphylococcus lugdunensis]MCH8680071.1 DUF3310 domain-containing protein [Staphylococcus lugdunensis]MCI2760240.1 DUF3310 domain-containing protein [Staphylococcus lugdunensis]MCI2794754.1 DUF3310 domain-containing protein [Staphylococcus lugdunensis]MCI2797019.1 DUF3310 domain-containing protein [Staphylococcus lugdunensis]